MRERVMNALKQIKFNIRKKTCTLDFDNKSRQTKGNGKEKSKKFQAITI